MTRSAPVKVNTYGIGLDSTSSPEDVGQGVFTVSHNFRYRNGAAYTRGGLDLVSNVGTGSPVKNAAVVERCGALFVNSGTKIKYSLNGTTWYDTGLTRTATETDGMLGHTKEMFVNNAVDGMSRIVCSLLKNGQTIGGSTLDLSLGDGLSFPTSGSGRINDMAISWTGKTVDQLTGVTGLTADVAAGDMFIRTEALAGGTKGTMMAALEGSMIVAGNPEHPDTVYYSAPSTPTNPQYFYDFTPANGGGSKKLSGQITALYGAGDVVIIGFKNKMMYSPGFQFNSSGSVTGLITRDLSKTDGVPGRFCFSDMEGEIVANTGVRILPIVANQDGASIIRDNLQPRNNLDYGISGFLKKGSNEQSSAYVYYTPKKRELYARVIGADEIPVEAVYCQDVGGGLAWGVDTGTEYGLRVRFKNQDYAFSETDDSVFIDEDSPTDNGSPINSRIVTGSISFNDELSTGDIFRFVMVGAISGAGEFTFRSYIDGAKDVEEVITYDFLLENGYLQEDEVSGLGSITLGGGVMGSGSSEELYRFILPIEMKAVGERVQFEWEINTEGTQFELRKSLLERETVDLLELTNF